MIFLVFNFFLELIFNRLFNSSLFFLVSLMALYPKIINEQKKYFLILFISGFIYDISITNIISINAILFLFIGFVNIIYTKNINDKLINNLIFLNAMLILYRILLYLFFIIVEISSFNICNFFSNLPQVLIINSIYYIILFMILKKKKR